jgi:uncharacterized membrane protein
VKKKDLLVKVFSWRLVSLISMLLTLWVLTGDFIESTSITVIVQIIQTMVHGLFEYTWDKHKKT